jgi:hypothetical protein
MRSTVAHTATPRRPHIDSPPFATWAPRGFTHSLHGASHARSKCSGARGSPRHFTRALHHRRSPVGSGVCSQAPGGPAPSAPCGVLAGAATRSGTAGTPYARHAGCTCGRTGHRGYGRRLRPPAAAPSLLERPGVRVRGRQYRHRGSRAAGACAPHTRAIAARWAPSR